MSYRPRLDEVRRVGKAICRARCAHAGEAMGSRAADCVAVADQFYAGAWPPPGCNDPGCMALARVAIAALYENLFREDAEPPRKCVPARRAILDKIKADHHE